MTPIVDASNNENPEGSEIFGCLIGPLPGNTVVALKTITRVGMVKSSSIPRKLHGHGGSE
jgi:hypothetical protein